MQASLAQLGYPLAAALLFKYHLHVCLPLIHTVTMEATALLFRYHLRVCLPLIHTVTMEAMKTPVCRGLYDCLGVIARCRTPAHQGHPLPLVTRVMATPV